ncbi:MAG: hypothetical protein ACLURG_07925 [Gemmiger sp.]
MAGKNLRKPPRAARRKTTAAVLLVAFGCGVGSCMLLLAACAFLLTHTALPLGLVRPMACMAAAAGRQYPQQFCHISAGKSCFCAGWAAVCFIRLVCWGHHCWRAEK